MENDKDLKNTLANFIYFLFSLIMCFVCKTINIYNKPRIKLLNFFTRKQGQFDFARSCFEFPLH